MQSAPLKSQSQTIWAETALTPAGWASEVTVQFDPDGVIISVQANTAESSIAHANRVGILLPAPANLHSHAFQRAMAGLTERRGPGGQDSFWTWRQLMYRFLDTLGPDDVEAIAAFAYMEMLEAGYAAVGEFHYLHHQPGGQRYANPAEMSERIAAAADSSGIGLCLLPVIYEQGGCDGRVLTPQQQRFANNPDQFDKLLAGARNAISRLGPDTRIGVAPHSLRAVSQQTMGRVSELIPDGPVHIHIAEQRAEIDEVIDATGSRPVQWLMDNCPVDSRWCLVHATHMTPAETDTLAASKAVAGLCPITEANLGDGVFDGARFIAGGGRLGVGSDSNVRISLNEELRWLEYTQRLRDHSRSVLATEDKSSGRFLYEAAARGGAQACARAAGEISVGCLADLVALNPEATALAGRRNDQLLDSFVFAGGDNLVADVWAAGRHVVHNGEHHRHDDITADYQKTIARLQERL